MRVMVLTADYPPQPWSGIGVAVARQTQALGRLGVEVHVLCGHPQKGRTLPTGSSQCAGNVFLHDLGGERFPINTRGFDCIHLHSLALAELALELKRRTGIPLAYTAHSVVARELAGIHGAECWTKLQLSVMRSSDAVVFLSESERQAGIEMAPEIAGRFCVIGNCVPLPPLTHRLRREGYVMFAGRFARSKGIALLAELLPEIQRYKKLKFVLAGGHGDTESERLITEMAGKLGDFCCLPGWLEQSKLEDLFSRAALVLVPSDYEPFGLVALEAMRMGAPVLAAPVGGLAEIVAPDSGGCLASSRDKLAWLQQVLEIIDNPGLSFRLQQQGPAYVAGNFHCERIASALIESVYEKNFRSQSPVSALARKEIV